MSPIMPLLERDEAEKIIEPQPWANVVLDEIAELSIAEFNHEVQPFSTADTVIMPTYGLTSINGESHPTAIGLVTIYAAVEHVAYRAMAFPDTETTIIIPTTGITLADDITLKLYVDRLTELLAQRAKKARIITDVVDPLKSAVENMLQMVADTGEELSCLVLTNPYYKEALQDHIASAKASNLQAVTAEALLFLRNPGLYMKLLPGIDTTDEMAKYYQEMHRLDVSDPLYMRILRQVARSVRRWCGSDYQLLSALMVAEFLYLKLMNTRGQN